MSCTDRAAKNTSPGYTFEIFPPKGDRSLDGTYAVLDGLAALGPDLISVTYGAGGSSRDNTIQVAAGISRRYGIRGVAHLTCVGTTVDSVAKILDELRTAGVHDVLALRGDLPGGESDLGDFHHASELISFIREHDDSFRIFAACYPEKHSEAPSLDEDLINLREKCSFGVEALISQLFYDNDVFCRWRDMARGIGITQPIIAGIMPLTSAAQVDKVITMCGATVPERVRRMVDAYAHNSQAMRDAGTAYATWQILDLLARGVDGIHIYTMNQPDVVRRIDEGIRSALCSLRRRA